jgi:hypothetical protein
MRGRLSTFFQEFTNWVKPALLNSTQVICISRF